MKKCIQTTQAPLPIGPYSQAVLANGILFVSGQIAINPSDGNLILTDIHEETRQVMKNIESILKEAGMDRLNVVKTTIFLSDMKYFSSVNEVYATYFRDNYPARETVQVSRLPKDVNVEISVIAVQ